MKNGVGFNDTQIKQLTNIVGGVIDSKLKIELKPIHKKLNKLQSDLTTTIGFFDHITIDHAKRLEKVEFNRRSFAN